MIRKIALVLAFIAGLFLLVSPLALGYFGKSVAADDLTGDLRPAFSNSGLNETKTDMATVNVFAADFTNKAVPALAKDLNMTPQQFVAAVSKNYPDVGKGLAQLPTDLPYFNGLVNGLATQQDNFKLADQIPTTWLPTVILPILFIILGVVALVVTVIALRNPNNKAGAVAFLVVGILGVAIIGATYLLSVPTKTQAVDNLTNAFRPVFTTQGANLFKSRLDTVTAMDNQLNSQALPGLAKMLKLTPAQFNATVQKNFPNVATGIKEMPQILNHFDGIQATIQKNINNFKETDSIPTSSWPTTLVQAQFVAPAILLIIAGAIGYGLALAGAKSEAETRPTTAAV